jgi:hypothetical protein
LRDDRIPEGVDTQRSKRTHHRIGRWEEKSENERGGVGEGYFQELTESRLFLFADFKDLTLLAERAEPVALTGPMVAGL